MTATDVWLTERPRLLVLAYTVSGHAQVPRDLPAWLTTVVSRLTLDAATTAAKRREEYVGQWLPEVRVGKEESAEDRAVLGEQVDLAFVRMLQALTPVDRVIVTLADVAGLSHKEIAEVTGTTAAATRQRLRRARASLRQEDATGAGIGLPLTADRVTLDALATALNTGDLQALVDLLSEGCVLWTDSGGLSKAARNPIYGPSKVTRFLAGLIGKYGMPQVSVQDAVGGTVLRAVSTDMTRIVTLEVVDRRITGLQIQQNPHKISGPSQ